MKNIPVLTYQSIFESLLEEKFLTDLYKYEDRELWMQLNSTERNLLAQLFLLRSEELIAQSSNIQQITESFLAAQELDPTPEILCRMARASFRFGLIHRNVDMLKRAISLLNLVFNEHSAAFTNAFDLWHFWGNVLLTLGQYSIEPSLCVEGLKKCEQSLAILDYLIKEEQDPIKRHHLKNHHGEIFWHCGLAWILMGRKSGEASDTHKACKYYRQAEEAFSSAPAAFLMDFGTGYLQLGRQTGRLNYVLIGQDYLKQAIVESYPIQEGLAKERGKESIYTECWIRFADGWKLAYELSYLDEYFLKAEDTFQQVVVLLPKKESLWLDWSKLYLTHGWFHRSSQGFESCIEKMNSNTFEKSDQITIASYLSQALTGFGIIWDDLKFLREGLNRILPLIEASYEHPELFYAAGLSSLGFGNYFNEKKYFLRAVDFFEMGLALQSQSVDCLHGLFLAYMAIGEIEKDPDWFAKGHATIQRICEKFPDCCLYKNEYGVSLMKLRDFEWEDSLSLPIIEKAIAAFEEAIALCGEKETPPELDWLCNYGCALDAFAELTLDENCFEKAITIFKEILHKDPHHSSAFHYLALALSHYGDHISDADMLMESATLFEQLVTANPEDEVLLYDFGYALLTLSDLVYDVHHPDKSLHYMGQAEHCLMQSARLGNIYAYYLLACLYSLSECYDQAIAFLERAAMEQILPSIEDLMHDEWLENLRDTQQFKEFISTRRNESNSG